MPKEKIDIEDEATLCYKDATAILADHRRGTIKREDADSFTNTIGKSLKALALIGAERQFQLDQKAFGLKLRIFEQDARAIEHKS